jgi:hypothetical protein
MHECRIHYPRRRLPSPSTEPIAPLTEILRGKGSDIRLWPTDERKVYRNARISQLPVPLWTRFVSPRPQRLSKMSLAWVRPYDLGQASNGVIGRDGTMPWYLPGNFRALPPPTTMTSGPRTKDQGPRTR